MSLLLMIYCFSLASAFCLPDTLTRKLAHHTMTAGTVAFGLKDVKGALTSVNAIPEYSEDNQASHNDIQRAFDHSHSRLTFRANLTTLTEAERRKLESHKSGEDLYDKVTPILRSNNLQFNLTDSDCRWQRKKTCPSGCPRSWVHRTKRLKRYAGYLFSSTVAQSSLNFRYSSSYMNRATLIRPFNLIPHHTSIPPPQLSSLETGGRPIAGESMIEKRAVVDVTVPETIIIAGNDTDRQKVDITARSITEAARDLEVRDATERNTDDIAASMMKRKSMRLDSVLDMNPTTIQA